MLKPSAIVELVWQDASGSTTATTLSAPSDLSVADIDASASALASLLIPMTRCSLIKQRIRYKWVPEERPVPAGDTPIHNAGAFFFSTGTATPDTMIAVPSIKDSLFVVAGPGAGVRIDLENADVIALVAAVLDLGGTNPFGDAIELLFAAYLQSRI